MGKPFADLSEAQKAEFAALVHARYDGWMNLITGLGSSRDKRTGARFVEDSFLSAEDLENLYNGDDMAAKAVEMIVVDSLASGITVTSGDAADASDAKEEADEVKALLDELDAEDKVAEAATWGRLYGAGAILLGANDGRQPTAELIDDNVRSLDFLTTLELRDLFVEQYYGNPMKANYGQPEIFRIQPVTGTSSMVSSLTQYVHASRLIMFDGVRTSRRKKVTRQGWSLSVLQRLYEVLRDANSNWSSTAHLMTDANLAVIKIKGFLEMIAGKDVQDFQTRMEMVDMAKSVARAYPIDANDEDYRREATNFANYPELLDRTWQRLASAMPESTPVTKLLGMSPAGMNATGDSDERIWGKSVEGYRRKKLKRPFERIARLAARTIGVSEPDSICVSFPPYRQLSPVEEAQRRKSVADADHIYITDGVWLAEEVATARVKGGEYSADPPIVDMALRERVLAKQLKSYEANAGKTPAIEGGGNNPDGTEGGQANSTTTGGGTVPADGDGNPIEG
jgi:phage-related protein (TIGR01555 family)